MSTSRLDYFVCPSCRGALARDAGAAVCRGCGARYADEPWGLDFFRGLTCPVSAGEVDARDREAEGYEADQARGKKPSFLRLQQQLVVDYLRGVDGPVLDAGCGTGLLSEALAASGHEVVGLDFSDASLRVLARKQLPGVALAKTDLGHIPVPDASFGAVVCSLVLQHVSEDARRTILAELRRALKPGGVLLVTAYNAAHFACQGKPTSGVYPSGVPYWAFTDAELTELLRAAGLTDVVARPFGLFLHGRSHRLAGRAYATLHGLLNGLERLAHPYLPARLHESDYWLVAGRKPREQA